MPLSGRVTVMRDESFWPSHDAYRLGWWGWGLIQVVAWLLWLIPIIVAASQVGVAR